MEAEVALEQPLLDPVPSAGVDAPNAPRLQPLEALRRRRPEGEEERLLSTLVPAGDLSRCHPRPPAATRPPLPAALVTELTATAATKHRPSVSFDGK